MPNYSKANIGHWTVLGAITYYDLGAKIFFWGNNRGCLFLLVYMLILG